MDYRVGDLIRAFDHETLYVARGLFARGEVALMPSGPDARRLFGLVRPFRGKNARVWASMKPRASGTWDGECTCPERHGCPHVAAVLLAGLGPEAEAAIERVAQRERRALVSRAMGPPPAMAKRRPEPSHAVVERPPEPDPQPDPQPDEDPMHARAVEAWLQGVETQLRPEAETTARPAPSKHRLVYLLEPVSGARSPDSLNVWPVVAYLKKNGAYGAQRRFTYDGGPRVPEYLADGDRELLTAIIGGSQRGWGFGFQSPVALLPQSGPALLERLLATGRCHWQHKDGPPLRTGPARRGTVEWTLDEDGTQRPRLALDGESSNTAVLPTQPPWYVDPADAMCGPVETDVPAALLAALLEAPRLSPDHARRARDLLSGAAGAAGTLPLPRVLEGGARDVHGTPVPVLRLELLRAQVPGSPFADEMPEPGLRLSFRYGDLDIPFGDRRAVVQRAAGDELIRIHRDRHQEGTAAETLAEMGWLDLLELSVGVEEGSRFVAIDVETDALDDFYVGFTREGVPALRSAGWIVEIAETWPFRFVEPTGWYAEVTDDTAPDWFELELGIEVDGGRISLLPLLVNLLRDRRHRALFEPGEPGEDAEVPGPGVMVSLADGRLLSLPADRLRAIVGTLLELYRADADQERLALPTWGAPRLAELEERLGPVRWNGGERLRELGRSLRTFRGLETVAPPDGFHGELRPYQRQGVDWLQFLRAHGLSGILADDMGLGKTVQLLAHLLVERRAGRADRPSLIVMPTSLLANWRQEAARFAPELRVLTLHGPKRRGLFDTLGECDLALTTYPLLHRDAERLRDQPYHLAVFDEAQVIKNAGTKAARAARTLEARQRICLTGTPMENHLGELWSLFHLLEPGLLGDRRQFGRIFRTPIEQHGDAARRAALAARVRPFLLRRGKDEVAADLPPKSEMTHMVELHAGQRDLYESIRAAMHERVRKEVARKGLAQASIVILDALLRLRQVCCDPRLVKLKQARRVKESAKLDALLEMLDELVPEGRRILLFSQFTSMLARIETALGKRGLSWVKLTGQTRDRETPVCRFQNREVPLFLISLKAGGTGLNLTAADTVIHYDPWWNPAVEDQATDRAHRIGQDKPVFVYKLIVAGSVEEKMLALGARKRALAEGVYGDSKQAGTVLSAEDLEVLFRPLE